MMKISRSCYYAYRARIGSGSRHEAEARAVEDCFWNNSRRYGSRRIAAELGMGRFLVRRLMQEQNLVAIQPKSYRPQTTDSSHGQMASPNLLLDPRNEPKSWGECVVGDITYVPTREGWAYLAMFQDKRTKRIVGWAISNSMTAELVARALQMALRRGLIKRRCIVHTDRGSQYVSKEFRSLLERHGLRQSMSGKGNCYDNAQAESFFSRFKTELVEGGVFASLDEARSETFTYIESFYNRRRLHSTLGYLTPIEFDYFLRFDKQDLLNEILNQPVKRRRKMLASIPSRNNRPKPHQPISRADLLDEIRGEHSSPQNPPQNQLIGFQCLKNANFETKSTQRSERILS